MLTNPMIDQSQIMIKQFIYIHLDTYVRQIFPIKTLRTNRESSTGYQWQSVTTKTSRNLELFFFLNINLNNLIPFRKWCEKIDPFMQASDLLNLVIKNKHPDNYQLLPLFWQAMDLDMNKTVMEMENNQGNVWIIDFLSQLNSTCNWTNADSVSFQTFVSLATEEPSHLDQGL